MYACSMKVCGCVGGRKREGGRVCVCVCVVPSEREDTASEIE